MFECESKYNKNVFYFFFSGLFICIFFYFSERTCPECRSENEFYIRLFLNQSEEEDGKKLEMMETIKRLRLENQALGEVNLEMRGQLDVAYEKACSDRDLRKDIEDFVDVIRNRDKHLITIIKMLTKLNRRPIPPPRKTKLVIRKKVIVKRKCRSKN